MSEWVDFAVYAMLIVTLWFVLPAWSVRFTLPFVADRNPEWLSSHPDVAAKLSSSRWHRWLYHGWGTVSLGVLLAFQMELAPAPFTLKASQKWEVLKEVNSLLLLPGIVLYIGAGVLFALWLHRTVPLAARRQATLERRSIDDFVPRWVRAMTYGALATVLLAWVTVGLLNWYSTPKFWGRFAFLFALTPVFAFFVRAAVNRPPHALDRIFGPRFRSIEVRIGFAMYAPLPLIGVVRLYEEVAGTALMDLNRAMHLGVALIVAGWALRFATLSSSRNDGGRLLFGNPSDLLSPRI